MCRQLLESHDSSEKCFVVYQTVLIRRIDTSERSGFGTTFANVVTQVASHSRKNFLNGTKPEALQ